MTRRPSIKDIGLPAKFDVDIEQAAAAKLMESGLVTVEGVPRTVIKGGEDDEEDIAYISSDYVLYESIIDGKSRYFPATTATPKGGKFYGIKTYEDNDRSRILLSHKDFSESFPFSEGPVLTKYGVDMGKTCNVTLKLVDVLLDIATERVIGVYLVIMTPSFAQIDVDAVRLIREVEVKDIARVKEAVLVHEALMLKFQLKEAVERAETYRQALFNRETDIVKLAEDFAAPIIENTLAALSAAKNMFEEYYRHKNDNVFKKYWKHILGAALLTAIGLLVYFFGPWGG